MTRNVCSAAHVVRWYLTVMIVLASSSGDAIAQTSTAKIYENSKRSVVFLLAYDMTGIPSAIGTGFFIEPTKIVTNAHVVRLASKVVYRVLGAERTLTAKEISNYSEKLDLAVLEAAEPGTPLRLSAADAPQIGEKVIVIGNPKGLEGSVSEGIVAGVRGTDTSRLIQITAPISPGNSGGPVFNSQGEVMGVATATLRDAQNINFAVPSSLISQLRAAGKNWEPQIQNRGVEVRRATAGVEFVEVVALNYASNFKNMLYSIQNNNSYPIRNLRWLVVLRNKKTKNVVSYSTQSFNATIPPGLASRTETRLTGGEYYSVYSDGLQAPGELEFRILTYEIEERGSIGDSGADSLLK